MSNEVSKPNAGLPEVGTLADFIAGVCIDMPQVECPVIHHFGPGIYIRELSVPRGTLLVGHRQRFPHMNIMLTGLVILLNEDGTTSYLKAPAIFVGQPGQKVGYIAEDMVWQNIYATEETDIETLEATFLDKSQVALDREAYEHLANYANAHADRQDFLCMAQELGTSPEEIWRQTSSAPLTPFLGTYSARISVRPSPIDGRGVFLSAPVSAGETIAPASFSGVNTLVGRFTNHAKAPNARAVRDGVDVYFVALRNIRGSVGGGYGEEVTVDYRQVRKEVAP